MFSQAGDKRTREVAAEFERFRDAIAQVVPGAVSTSPVPTHVVLFESERAFAPFSRSTKGRRCRRRLFVGTEGDNMTALADN